jgi:ribosome-binding factor A
MPELSFIFDTEQEKRARIDELLEMVKCERVGNVPED